jgi:hypothetical protein
MCAGREQIVSGSDLDCVDAGDMQHAADFHSGVSRRQMLDRVVDWLALERRGG